MNCRIPHTKSFPDSKFWKPYGENREYLKIGNNSDTSMSPHDDFDSPGTEFWDTLSFTETVGSYIHAFTGPR